jgi:hypothetical protein
MKDIREQIDDGEITPNEAAAQLALITAMQKKLKARESVLRDYCTENIDPKNHITTSLGEVAYKRGSEGSWKVKDPLAFARELRRLGEDASVVTVDYPVDFATKPDEITALIQRHLDELESPEDGPEGVVHAGERDDSVAVKLPNDWELMFDDPVVLGQASEMLGIEAPKVAADDDLLDAEIVEDAESDPWSEVQA